MKKRMQRRLQRRLQMRGGEITQPIVDALKQASETTNSLAEELTRIAADSSTASASSVGGTKKRKLKTRRRKTMKR
jgi:hypothetical protein